jgi:hypothetical protein
MDFLSPANQAAVQNLINGVLGLALAVVMLLTYMVYGLLTKVRSEQATKVDQEKIAKCVEIMGNGALKSHYENEKAARKGGRRKEDLEDAKKT